jgi:hypothetical protein
MMIKKLMTTDDENDDEKPRQQQQQKQQLDPAVSNMKPVSQKVFEKMMLKKMSRKQLKFFHGSLAIPITSAGDLVVVSYFQYCMLS